MSAKEKAASALAVARNMLPTSEAARLRLELAALKVERDFWVEQARNLQNHLQTVMRGQAAMLEQMGRGPIHESDVHAAIQQVAQELREPLTTVEAIAALTAGQRSGTQGAYTAVQSTPARSIRKA